LILQGAEPKHKTEKNLFTLQTLELLKPSQEYPRLSPLGPDGEGVLTGGEVGHGEVNKLQGSSIGLTSD
jgi:hypothetical protein